MKKYLILPNNLGGCCNEFFVIEYDTVLNLIKKYKQIKDDNIFIGTRYAEAFFVAGYCFTNDCVLDKLNQDTDYKIIETDDVNKFIGGLFKEYGLEYSLHYNVDVIVNKEGFLAEVFMVDDYISSLIVPTDYIINE